MKKVSLTERARHGKVQHKEEDSNVLHTITA